MNFDLLVAEAFDEHARVLAATRAAVAPELGRLVAISAAAVRRGGKIVFFGNGGSAADAQHLATELTVRFRRDRPPIAALALTTDTSALTAIGNDLGFAALFARQIEALCGSADVCIGISTSGRSENVCRGLAAARALGAVAAAFGGGDGGAMKELAAPLVLVPAASTARVQEMHIILGHIFCAGLEQALGLG